MKWWRELSESDRASLIMSAGIIWLGIIFLVGYYSAEGYKKYTIGQIAKLKDYAYRQNIPDEALRDIIWYIDEKYNETSYDETIEWIDEQVKLIEKRIAMIPEIRQAVDKYIDSLENLPDKYKDKIREDISGEYKNLRSLERLSNQVDYLARNYRQQARNEEIAAQGLYYADKGKLTMSDLTRIHGQAEIIQDVNYRWSIFVLYDKVRDDGGNRAKQIYQIDPEIYKMYFLGQKRVRLPLRPR